MPIYLNNLSLPFKHYYLALIGIFIISLVSCTQSPTPAPSPTPVCATFSEFSRFASCIGSQISTASAIAEVAVSCGGIEFCLERHAEAIAEISVSMEEECPIPDHLQGAELLIARAQDVISWKEQGTLVRNELSEPELSAYQEYNFDMWRTDWEFYLDTLHSVRENTCVVDPIE